MTFKLIINTDNDSFSHDTMSELAMIINQVATRVNKGQEEGIVRDYNGNTIGSFSLEE